MATKLENAVIRRVGFSTPLYEIVEFSILPATDTDPEILEISVRNPRHPSTELRVPLEQALSVLFPGLWGLEPETGGGIDMKSLEDAIMTHGEITTQDRARFFNIVREVQKGDR